MSSFMTRAVREIEDPTLRDTKVLSPNMRREESEDLMYADDVTHSGSGLGPNPVLYAELLKGFSGYVSSWAGFYVMRGTDGYLYTGYGAGHSGDSFWNTVFLCGVCHPHAPYEMTGLGEDYYDATNDLVFDGLPGYEVTRCGSWAEACDRVKEWGIGDWQSHYTSYGSDDLQGTASRLIERLMAERPVKFDQAVADEWSSSGLLTPSKYAVRSHW